MSNKEKTSLTPKLRFPEFLNTEGWTKKELAKCLDYLQPTQYLVSSTAYNDSYEIPVVTAGKTFILGHTNETEGIFDSPLPVIIFDDFTTASQYVDFRFKAKSSAMKILLAKQGANIKFIYESMQKIDYEVGAHGRHWIAAYSKINVAVPKLNEQGKIADCLSSLDELIAAQARKVNALKTHKNGLMQQLFPREGETQPRLRFQKFQNAGEWQKRKISALLTKSVRPVNVDSGATYREIGIRSHGKGIFHKKPISGKALGDKRVFWVAEEALVLNIVFAWEQAVAVTSLAEKGMIASHRFPMYSARPNKAHVHFIKYFFLSEKGRELLGIASPGGAGRNKTLGQKNFENLEFWSPCTVDEQKEIANTLSSLDALISIQCQNLESLKTHKKGLMQQLFPSVDTAKA